MWAQTKKQKWPKLSYKIIRILQFENNVENRQTPVFFLFMCFFNRDRSCCRTKYADDFALTLSLPTSVPLMERGGAYVGTSVSASYLI